MVYSKFPSKKAQVEIMGLVIIVILIVIIIFVVLVFMLNKKPNEVVSKYSDSQYPTAFILALLDTSSMCQDHVPIKSLIYDCAVDKRIHCPSSDTSSCKYLNESLTQIFDSTLNAWGENYEFKMDHAAFIHYNNFTFSSGCGPYSTVETNPFQIIPLWPRRDFVRVSMKICSN